MAKNRVARDKAIVLNQNYRLETQEVVKAFTVKRYCGTLEGNDWKCDVREFDEKFYKDSLDQMLKKAEGTLSFGDGDVDYFKKLSTSDQIKIINESASIKTDCAITLLKSFPDLRECILKKESPYKHGGGQREGSLVSENRLLKDCLNDIYPDSKQIALFSLLPEGKSLLLNKVGNNYCNQVLFHDLENKTSELLSEIVVNFPEDYPEIIDAVIAAYEKIYGRSLKEITHCRSVILSASFRENEDFLLNLIKRIASDPDQKEPELTRNFIKDFIKVVELRGGMNSQILRELEKESLKKYLPPEYTQNGSNIDILKERLPEFSSSECKKEFVKRLTNDNLSLISRYLPSPLSKVEQSFVGRNLTYMASFDQANHYLDLWGSSYLHGDAVYRNAEFEKSQFHSIEIAKPRQTFLNIVGLRESEIENFFEAKDFSDIASIKFMNCSLSVVKKILEQQGGKLRSLKHCIFDTSLAQTSKEVKDFTDFLAGDTFKGGISYENVPYEKYWDLDKFLESIDEMEKILPAIEEKLSILESQAAQGPKAPNKICVAAGGFSKKLKVDQSGEVATFRMAEAGEVLNNFSQPLSIRDAVIKTQIESNLDQEEYVPSEFVAIENPKTISDNEIENFKTKDSSKKLYCQFNLNLKAGKKYRLLSLDAAEQLEGIVGDISGLTIEKGDDDFFYATSNKDRNLTYVLSAPNPQQDLTSYGAIPSNNPIKKIIDEYRGSEKFTHVAEKEKEAVRYDKENHDKSMIEMFEERSGVCRHRVAAVEYKLRTTQDINQENFRVVGINGNHVILEIKHNDKWVKVDLGGGEGQMNNLDESQKYSSAPVEKSEKVEESKVGLDDLAKASDNNSKAANPSVEVDDKRDESEEIREKEDRSAQIKKEAFDQMAKSFQEISKLPEVANEEDLKTQTTDSDKSKILVVTDKIEEHSNFFLRQAKEADRPTFYIDNPSKIDLHRTNLLIANDNNIPVLSDEGLLSDFLKKAAENSAARDLESTPKPRPLFLINWSAFNTKQRLALNTVLDIERKIHGEKLDESIQIIGLSSETSQDPSFLSRHDVRIESKVKIANPEIEIAEPKDPKIIDLQGFPNWRRNLFGKVVLVGGKMHWQKSDFVDAISTGGSFEITNLSAQAAAEFNREFQQARATGKFIYHGHEIACHPNLEIKCAAQSFNFGKFGEAEKVIVNANQTFDRYSDYTLINAHLFDRLLCDKTVENGNYFEKPGLIERCLPNQSVEKLLKLFISSDLSESQWYCLFEQAREKDVKLELHLAPDAKLPSAVKTGEFQNVVKATDDKPETKAKILVSNNAAQTLQNLRGITDEGGLEEREESETDQIYAVIDVEDFSYQDLVERITFEKGTKSFENFQKIESELLTKLKERKQIVLKGEFSTDLLQMLEPLLVDKEPFLGLSQYLTVIIEDKSCQAKQDYKPLKWLGQGEYEIKTHEVKSGAFTDRPFVEDEDKSGSLENSADKSASFIKTRKNKFLETLRTNSMLRLVGHSGVGKSRLLKEFETHDQKKPQFIANLLPSKIGQKIRVTKPKFSSSTSLTLKTATSQCFLR